ncbi:MAG: glycosyltransferase family 2 protein [Treponema sp.]|uniref:glycosyltransferase family 2 protein n=1 Tax=Treponema sp. TaxID=166 RepID=UPI0025F472AD|nr:glycosyltransferase [Treponema sp.]MBQ9282061.1 glycosyltransferase family 2 protein [Treponema sp.]
MDKTLISMVVPCFNEELAIPKFYEEANRVVLQMNIYDRTEFVFVDDGSSDGTLRILEELAQNDRRVHFLSFSRNFGKEAALYAGLSKANGKFTALMDADLQDPPSLLPEMFESLQKEGFDCAATRRVTRKNEPPVRSFFARIFYKIMGKISDVPVVDGARDFRLMSEQYKNAMLSLRERNRFTKGIFPWVGFRTKWFAYENVERVAGETKWSFWKLFLYSIDGIIGFSTKPLAFSAFMGILAIFAALLLIAFIVIRRLVFGDPVQGWASTVCIIVFLSGIQLFSLGISGLYISKIYTEVKNRPLFIIRKEK